MREKFKIDNNERQFLKSIGFKSIGDGIYKYEFPGYKWHGYTTIICRFTAFDDSNEITVDVLNENGELYAPYYSNDKNNSVLAIVKSNIKKEMKKCGIEYKEKI